MAAPSSSTPSPALSRSSSSHAPGSVPAPAPAAADLDSLVQSKQFQQILAVAQQKELEDGGTLRQDSEQWYCIELFAAALANQLPSTRFIWKRISKDLKKRSKDLTLIWKQMQFLHKADFASFFSASISDQGSLSLPLFQRLNAHLREEVQSQNIHNIRKAYTNIGVNQAATLLGLKRDQVAAFVTNLGWRAEPAGQNECFQPTPLQLPKPREISPQQLEQLTRYTIQLED